jgi:hypothetical protein
MSKKNIKTLALQKKDIAKSNEDLRIANESNDFVNMQMQNMADECNKLVQYSMKITTNFTENNVDKCEILAESSVETSKNFNLYMFNWCDQLFYISNKTAKNLMRCRNIDDLFDAQKQMIAEMLNISNKASEKFVEIFDYQSSKIVELTSK